MSQIIHEKQDMTFLLWSVSRQSSGTTGSFLKSYSLLGNKKTYYKLSNFDRQKGVVGHESVNEIIVDRLLDILGVPHLHYQLIHADISVGGQIFETFLCASADFKRHGESKIALDDYFERECRNGESPLNFCIRKGWAEYIYQMLVVDFLILNRDRHGANIEILKNKVNKTVYPAPLFDHGLSLLFNCQNDAAAIAYNIMEDKQVNNFVGSKSTWENLSLIQQDKMPVFNPLQKSDRMALLDGLDGILSPVLLNKIWEMIWGRWCAYEDFCHSR